MNRSSVIGIVAALCVFAGVAYADYYSYNGDWRSVYLYKDQQQGQGGYYNYSGDWRVTYRVPFQLGARAYDSRRYAPQQVPLYYPPSAYQPWGAYGAYGSYSYPYGPPVMTTHVSRNRNLRFFFRPRSCPTFAFGGWR